MTIEELLGNLELPIHKTPVGILSLSKTVNDIPKINTNEMETSGWSFYTHIWNVNLHNGF